MRKNVVFLFFLIFFSLITITEVQAASNVTYFYGEAVKITDEEENIEILSDEMIIDTKTSKVTHTILLQNNANYEVETKITVPLENKELSTKVKNVNIIVNDFKIETVNNEGNYIINTKIPGQTGKKIVIQYETENDLQNAKVIKYNLDNYKGKKIGKEKVEIIFDETEIPLITGVYPGHYTFDNNTISVEYYGMNVNTITREVIVEKETYSNLLYGREYAFSEDEIRIIKNAKKWIEDGIEIDYNKVRFQEEVDYKTIISDTFYGIFENELGIKSKSEYFLEITDNPVIDNILKYVVCKQIIEDNQYKIRAVILGSQGSPSEGGILTVNSKLIYEMLYNNRVLNDKELEYGKQENYNLYGKKVCIEFVATEQDKELYRVERDYWGDENGNFKEDEYFPIREKDVLKARANWASYFNGAKVIYVGESIDGSSLSATEEEKIEYVNSIGADLYIRNELYSGNKEFVEIGYYNNEDKEMAVEFSFIEADIEERLIKLQNDYFSKNCRVPVLILFVGKINNENGRYVVRSDKGIQEFSGVSGLRQTYEVIQTKRAQHIINSNKQENKNKRDAIEEKISNIKLLKNEQNIQNQLNKKEELEVSRTEQKIELFQTKDIIILSTIVFLIFVCFIIIVISNRRK